MSAAPAAEQRPPGASAAAAAAAAAAEAEAADDSVKWLADLELDQTKLAAAVSADQGEVFILQWLSKAERALHKLEPDAFSPAQSKFHSHLLSIACPPQPTSQDAAKRISFPKPGRPVRHLLSRCYVISLTKCQTRSLFDILQHYLRIAADDGAKPASSTSNGASAAAAAASAQDRDVKVACLSIVGDIFAALGQNVMSLFGELTVVCQRLLKNHSLPPIVRFHAMACLERGLRVGAKSLNDQPGKELLKALRLGLADKAGAVVRGCAASLRVLLRDTVLFDSRAEIDALLSAGIRALETADFVTKRSLSAMIAELLASTQRAPSMPPPPPPATKKSSRKKGAEGADRDSDDEQVATPTTAGSIAAAAAAAAAAERLMSPTVMLEQLSVPFGRPTTSRRARIALLDVYASLFGQLGAPWVQTNYGIVIRHLFEDLPNQGRSTSSRAETLVVRHGVSLIARKVIGEMMLGEQAQVAALLEIAASFVKRYPMLTPGQAPPSKHTLVLALDECSALLAQLGSVPPQVHESLYEPILRCLAHPSHGVQISAAWGLRTLCSVSPSQLSPAIESVLAMLHRDLDSLEIAGERSGAENARKTIGHARGLASLISIVPARPLFASFDASAKVLSLAIQLLKASGNHDLAIASVEIQTAWTLITSLMSLGPNFARDHLPQMLVLWRNALPKPGSTDGGGGAGASSSSAAASSSSSSAASGSGAPVHRSDAEWAFLMAVRECALTSIWAFLTHSGAALLNLDSARRIIVLLSNSLTFINGFASSHPHLSQEQVPGAERRGLSLLDREHMVRRRIFQCLTLVASNPALEPLADSLIPAALQTFAEPERYVGSAAQAAISASSGSFSAIWAMADGYAFGVTTLQRDSETLCAEPRADDGAAMSAASRSGSDGAARLGSAAWNLSIGTDATCRLDWLNRDAVENQLEALQRRPVLGAAEHDLTVLLTRRTRSGGGAGLSGGGDGGAASLGGVGVGSAGTRSTSSIELLGEAPHPPPPATAMVDAAIELFAALFAFRGRPVQVSAVEALLAHTRSAKLERNPGRRIAVQINACVALVGAMRVAMHGGGGGTAATGASSPNPRRPSGFNNERLTSAMRELLKDALLHGDLALRSVAAEAMGRLASVAGSHAMSSLVQFLVDQVVSNRDPDTRAGCALAFGRIYAEVGGLAAGPLTKTVVNILMSLSTDPHPTVHHSALNALRMVIEQASLSYMPFVASTLGMVAKLYMMPTHEPEGGSAGSGNLRADLPAYQAMCRVMSALIGVLGPDLQESAKVRGLLLTLMLELSRESDDGVVVEATKAMQHFALFASQHLDQAAWIEALRRQLGSSQRPLKSTAVNALYQLVQRHALLVSRVGGDSLVADLFAQLDNDPALEGVREVLLGWLRSTAELSPTSWIDLCQRIMTKAGPKSRRLAANAAASSAATAAQQKHVLQDEEAAAIDLGDDGAARSMDEGQSRWRTQLFALQCLHEVFATVRRAGRFEHFRAPPSAASSSSAAAAAGAGGAVRVPLMSERVGDLIRMAFTASTSANAEIRLEGLTVLRDVIDHFKSARDPDFDEARLLEQHQAPIAAALTPAFSAQDSTPAVLSAAIEVCAVFVGCGVVQDVERMGRILRLLVSALESCSDPDMRSLGEVKDMSANAAGVLKVAVLTAWGELKVASTREAYLVDVLRPHGAKLASLWVAALREYARLRGDPFNSDGLGIAGPGPVLNPALDSQYAGMTREVLMPCYEDAWARIMHAVATLLDERDPALLATMEGHDPLREGPGREGEAEGETKAPPLNPSPFRSEPCANFFVVYGLAFEALAVSAGAATLAPLRLTFSSSATLGGDFGSATTAVTASSSSSSAALVALHALRSVCAPELAGEALLQPAIYAEFCNLLWRVMMTATTAQTQAAVLDVVRTVLGGYGARLLPTAEDDGSHHRASSSEAQILSSDSKLLPLLGMVILALQPWRHHLFHSQASTQGKGGAAGLGSAHDGHVEQRAEVLRGAYATLRSIATLLPHRSKVQMCVAGLHAYKELLLDEGVGVELVAPTLPSLKELCEEAAALARHQSTSSISHGERRDGGSDPDDPVAILVRAVHGLLSATVDTVDAMRGRAGRVAEGKIKNSFLATTVAVTSLAGSVALSEVVLDQFCFQLGQRLPAAAPILSTNSTTAAELEAERAAIEVGDTALHCIRGILLASASKGDAALRFCAGQLLPHLVGFLMEQARAPSTAAAAERRRRSVVEEVLKSLAALVLLGAPEYRARLLGVVIPACVVLLDDDGEKPGRDPDDEGDATRRARSSSSALAASPSSAPSSLHALGVAQLLALATQAPSALREALPHLDADTRERLQRALHAAVASSASAAGVGAGGGANGGNGAPGSGRAEPRSIALRSFG